MAPASALLPKFRRPPLVEVVHGVQFDRLPISVVHPGLFFSRIRNQFPKVQTHPALPPLRPTFEPGLAAALPPPFQWADPGEVPRAWFIAEDDATLTQFQNDRLLFNWRHEPSKAAYPHFEQVHAGFEAMYRELDRFAADEGIGGLKPQLCEMTYINHIRPGSEGGKARPAHEIFRVLPENAGSTWSQAADAVNWNARYVLRRDDGAAFGRLTANLMTVFQLPSSGQMLQLEITVYGMPDGPDIDCIGRFHHLAHGLIVNYFAAITTDAAHQEWERFQ